MSTMHAPITATSPAELLSTIPHLLGFQPTNGDLVTLFTARGQVVLAMRAASTDFTTREQRTEQIRRALDAIDARGTSAEAVHLVAYADTMTAATLAALHWDDASAAAGLAPEVTLSVADGKWQSFDGQEGTIHDETTVTEVALIATGSAPAASRADAMAAAVPAPAGKERKPMDTANVPDFDRVEWRKGTSERIAAAIAEGDLSKVTDASLGILACDLADVGLRDALIIHMLAAPIEDVSGKWAPFLRRILASAHGSQAAPAATVLAIAYWAQGNEAATHAALDAATQAHDDYALAVLVRRIVDAHLSATKFAEVMPPLEACYSC